jgi:hypothetical protein
VIDVLVQQKEKIFVGIHMSLTLIENGGKAKRDGFAKYANLGIGKKIILLG